MNDCQRMGARLLTAGTASDKPAGALYWYGDQCEAVTGGWVLACPSNRPGIAPESYLRFGEDHMTAEIEQYSSYSGAIITRRVIPQKNYTKICFLGTVSNIRGNSALDYQYSYNEENNTCGPWSYGSGQLQTSLEAGPTIITIGSGFKAPRIQAVWGSGRKVKFLIYAVWLE